jgi:hypothetical protein
VSLAYISTPIESALQEFPLAPEKPARLYKWHPTDRKLYADSQLRDCEGRSWLLASKPGRGEFAGWVKFAGAPGKQQCLSPKAARYASAVSKEAG